MFSADLSWTEPDTEKVGERKERIAKEKERERSLPSATPSNRSSRSSQSSIQNDRELWWTAGLRKAKAMKPALKSRPGTGGSADRPRKVSIAVPQRFEIKTPDHVRDPKLQPGWTYSSSLSPILPSGALLEPPEHEVPELEGDLSSRRTDSSGSRSSHERQLGLTHAHIAKTMDQGKAVQRLDSRTSTNLEIRRSMESGQRELAQKSTPSPQEGRKKLRPYSRKVEGCLNLASVNPQDPTTIDRQRSYASGLSGQQMATWRPPSEWDIVLDKTERAETTEEKGHPALLSNDETAIAHRSTLGLSRFQRFIRRMESAGPKIILDRLKEEWNNPVDEETSEELVLEKELWLLTAFQLQNLSRYARFPKTNTGKILELFGNLSEVYQLSAMYPRQKVHYLATKPQQSIPLPGNVSYLTVPQAEVLPLPYSDSYFCHIRASSLPSLVPSSKLPQVFSECYRLLASGGMLEIRIMDAAPVRKTAGPKMKAWIEERVSENLERLFRCSRPGALVPAWLTDAGFDLPSVSPSEGEENVMLRCASDSDSLDVQGELSSLVGRALWKDIWGGFVDEVPGQARWWWEDEEVMEECLERQTVFECGTIFAFKG